MGIKTTVWIFQATNKRNLTLEDLTWLRKGNLKRETESLLQAAQNNAIRTNYVKAKIDKTQQNSKCWLCADRDETITHIISILSSKESTTRKLIRFKDELMIWCRMKFKPQKSRSLSLRRGKLNQNVNFEICAQRIPTVSDLPLKSLGRWHDESMKDTNQVKDTSKTLQEGLLKIDRCPLQGKYKVWCLQHVFIEMLLWPLLVYEISTSAVEKMEAKINKYIRKWLGLPPDLSNVAMYCRQTKLKLPLKSIMEEFKSSKVKLQMMLDDSKDKVIKSLNPTLQQEESGKSKSL